jgi:hypothetical protein
MNKICKWCEEELVHAPKNKCDLCTPMVKYTITILHRMTEEDNVKERETDTKTDL